MESCTFIAHNDSTEMVVEAPREQMVVEPPPREHRREKVDGYSLIADNHDDDNGNELSTIPSSGGHQQNAEGEHGFPSLSSSSSESSDYHPEQIEEREIVFPLSLLAIWLRISMFYL